MIDIYRIDIYYTNGINYTKYKITVMLSTIQPCVLLSQQMCLLKNAKSSTDVDLACGHHTKEHQ